jgi:hypothetical protein
LGIWETPTSDQKPDELVAVGKGMNLAIWQSGIDGGLEYSCSSSDQAINLAIYWG